MREQIIKHIREELSAQGNNNLKTIKSCLKTLGGKFVTDGYRIGYLVGATATYDDYYYVLLNKDCRVFFISCVGQINETNKNEVDLTEFKQLITLIQNEPYELKQSIEEYMKSCDDIFFTPLYIGEHTMFIPNQTVLSADENEVVARLNEIAKPIDSIKWEQDHKDRLEKRKLIKEEQTKMKQTHTKLLDNSSIIEEELQNTLQEMQNKYIYLLAEFENYKKRTQREKEELKKTANETLYKSLLDLVDDLERGMKQTNDEGLKIIHKNFINFLSQHNITVMDSENVSYDCNLHEAVGIVECGQNGIVIETVQKGYFLYDKVLRYAKVIVGN